MKFNKRSSVIFIILLAIMVSIFTFSSHTGTESSELSSKVTRLISRIIFRGFKGMTPSQQEFIIAGLHPFVRKLAHFSIYMLLGMFTYAFVTLSEIQLHPRTAVSWVFCIIYAAADEFHQSFTPGRSMQLRDVVIDSAGAFFGIIAAIVIIAVLEYIKNALKKEEK